MATRRSDPYYRNNAVAAAHLQMAGHTGARTEGWGGGTEGIVVPHPTSPHHQIEVGQSPDERGGGWNLRVMRHPDDPEYDQGGLNLGKAQINRVVGAPQPEKKMYRDDHYSSTVQAHPRDLPRVVDDFVNHPHVRAAVQRDVNAIQTRRPSGGHLGPQFG